MKSLIFFLTIFISFPCYSITWEEFWRPVRSGGYYSNYYPRYYRNCKREIHREETVTSNGMVQPHVKTFKETHYYPC